MDTYKFFRCPYNYKYTPRACIESNFGVLFRGILKERSCMVFLKVSKYDTYYSSQLYMPCRLLL